MPLAPEIPASAPFPFVISPSHLAHLVLEDCPPVLAMAAPFALAVEPGRVEGRRRVWFPHSDCGASLAPAHGPAGRIATIVRTGRRLTGCGASLPGGDSWRESVEAAGQVRCGPVDGPPQVADLVEAGRDRLEGVRRWVEPAAELRPQQRRGEVRT